MAAATERVTVDYAASDGTATAPADYASTSATLTFAVGETSKTVSVAIVDDSVEDDGETFTLTLSNASGATIADASATATIRNTEETPGDPALTASFSGMPTEHDGQSAFSFRVEFSEDIETSYQTLRDESFSVTDGDVTGARRVDGRHDLWKITVEPESHEVVDDLAPRRQRLRHGRGRVHPRERPEVAEQQPIGHRGGSAERPVDGELRRHMPAEHAGEGTFTFGLTFSEEVELNYVTLRDAAFSVSGGAVRKAEREQQGSNVAWEITVEPVSAGAVTIGLPETTDCDASGAILHRRRTGVVAFAVGDHRRSGGDRGGRCAGGRSRRRAAGLRGHAQPRVDRHGDGRLRHGGRQRAGGRGLDGGPRHAHLPGGRIAADGQRDGALRPARRGRGDADGCRCRTPRAAG